MVLIKMKLLIFLGFSQFGLAYKYGIMFQISIFITRIRGQYRYSRYLRDVIGWKLRHSGQYSPVLLAAIATAELFKYVSINKHRKIFEKFTTLCRTVSSFSDCQKHEYITVRHYREMKRWRHCSVFIFSLLHIT